MDIGYYNGVRYMTMTVSDNYAIPAYTDEDGTNVMPWDISNERHTVYEGGGNPNDPREYGYQFVDGAWRISVAFQTDADTMTHLAQFTAIHGKS